jgi:predicted MFS family arabinose efflux permease
VKRQSHPVAITATIYLLSVLAMATVGVVVPFIGNFAAALGAGKGAIALAIALFSAPTAIFATVGGVIIDRMGLRTSLIVASATMIVGDVIAWSASSLWVLYGGMLVSGFGYGVIAVGGPAMLIAVMEGRTRIRAMSFWSTYAPAGFAVGLLIAVPFANGDYWRAAQLAHAGLGLVLLLVALLVLPHVQRAVVPSADPSRRPGANLMAVVRDVPLLRLAVAVSIPNCISYGTSLVTPSYLAEVHHVSLAASSSLVAFAKIFAMTVGGVVMGHLLAREVSGRLLFICVAIAGAVAQVLIYLPASNMIVAIGALILWLFAFGGLSGTAMAVLPTLVKDPSRSAAASGLVNQFISLLSFATPSLYFGLSGWTSYVGLALAGLVVCIIAMPGGRRDQTAVNPPSTTNAVPEI